MRRSLGVPAQEDAIVLPKRAASIGVCSLLPSHLRNLLNVVSASMPFRGCFSRLAHTFTARLLYVQRACHITLPLCMEGSEFMNASAGSNESLALAEEQAVPPLGHADLALLPSNKWLPSLTSLSALISLPSALNTMPLSRGPAPEALKGFTMVPSHQVSTSRHTVDLHLGRTMSDSCRSHPGTELGRIMRDGIQHSRERR